MLSKQNQVILPIIIEDTDVKKYILPWYLQTLKTVVLSAIHKEGVVGFTKVIKKPVTNPFDVYLFNRFLESVFFLLSVNDRRLNRIRMTPDTIQNILWKLRCLLNNVNKPKFIITIYKRSAETAPKQVIYKIINFYREINNQQSKNNENLDELKRFTEKIYESKTASLDKANELTEQIIEAYSGNYTKDFLNAIIEIVILILNDYIVMRKMYCRYVCSKFQVKEGEKKCQK